jgi:DNA polymerase
MKWPKLQDVYDEVLDDPAWAHLRRPGINLVPGDGAASSEEARVMVVGEAPGAQENGARRPFVGPSGRVLDALLGTAGLFRQSVFITNVLKFRPPGNRTPSGSEIMQGIKALRKEWNIIRPVLTIAVGSPAQVALAQYSPPHGIIVPFANRPDAWVVSVYHPAFGLRKKQAQAWIEREWETIWEEIHTAGIEREILCDACLGRGPREEADCYCCWEAS